MSYQFKKLAGGKSSKDASFDELCNAYRGSKKKNETFEERKARINRFRCGW